LGIFCVLCPITLSLRMVWHMHPLDGSFLKLRRAKCHFQVAGDLVKGLHERQPYKIVTEFVEDGDARECIIRLKQIEEIPTDLPLVIGDICSNPRSALDHLLWQLWLLQDPNFDRRVYFPITDSPSSFRSDGFRHINGLSDSQRAAIESLQPYRTGKDALSMLRDLNNSDKHRLIQVIGVHGGIRRIGVTVDQTRSSLWLPQQRHIPLDVVSGSKIEHDAILARIPFNRYATGTEVRVQSYAVFDYVFEGSQKADGRSVEPSVASMISEASDAIALLEPEFAHLGTPTEKG